MKVLTRVEAAEMAGRRAVLRGGARRRPRMIVSGVAATACADVAGNAGRRPRLHLRPAVRHGLQRRLPRLGRGRPAHGPELAVEPAVDGQRLAGVLPALEGPAHRQEGDDARSRSSRPSRTTTSAACPSSGRTRTTRSTPTTAGTRTTPRSRSPARRARASACCSPRIPTARRCRRRSSARSTTRRTRPAASSASAPAAAPSRSATSPTAARTTTRRASR